MRCALRDKLSLNSLINQIRPARHFHYIEKYMLHFIRILAQTQDIEALSAIAPRLSLREAKITFVNGETIRQSFAEIYLEVGTLARPNDHRSKQFVVYAQRSTFSVDTKNC